MPNFAAIAKPGTTRNHKTGSWRVYVPILDKDKCIGCESCWEYCPDCCKVEEEYQGETIFTTDLDYCKGCGICAEECPVDAIEMELEEK